MSVNQDIPIDNQSDNVAPITLKVSQNTRAIIATKEGIAVYFPVSILSIFTLRICDLLSNGFITVLLQTLVIKVNLISARADCLSLPVSFSISIIICSSISFSFSSNFSLFKIIESPSTNFVAANLAGIFALLA